MGKFDRLGRGDLIAMIETLEGERELLRAALTQTESVRLRDALNTSELWRRVASTWQDWAKGLLDDLARQPLHGEHGDAAAREIIKQLAGMAPGVPRCQCCGCFATRHEVDDEELRGCADCECTQYTHGGPHG